MSHRANTNGARERELARVVPKLRFPQFREDGEWSVVALGEIAELQLGKMLDKQKHTAGRLMPYLNNISVRWGEVDVSNLPEMFFSADEYERFGLRAGDVVVCEGGEPGRAAVWDGRVPELKFQKAIHRVRFKSGFDPRLLVMHLENISGTPALERHFTGGGIKHLTRETFARLRIPLTQLAEQQTIAGCLSAVDEVIAEQQRKIDALKTHKNGLMQQLFPREGETRPRLRHFEFRGFGDWERKTIGSMVTESQRPLELAEQKEYRLVTVKRRYGGLVLRSTMKGREILVKSQFVVRTGDFLISKRQIVHNACGLVSHELDGSVVSNEYSVLTQRSGCSIEFFSWFAMQPAVSASFVRCSVGIVIEKMLFKLGEWLKQEFLFPPLAEQQRIADCLGSLDSLITAESRKLDALKRHKRGLMQQLFPSPEAARA